ncbi:hypothetical protein DPMN_001967 [Dreissena polymorpha]|uniref:Uncharacterized protein n=1 Tax=Dreissena polymorpha TaxID=45954 RepID=A0A9D4RTD7_DREPO|nr:hypothetical protein DPMN_001967 [Dreissena polymorpha]
MRTGPFTVSTDGSNDETSNQFPLVVRTMEPISMTVDSFRTAVNTNLQRLPNRYN